MATPPASAASGDEVGRRTFSTSFRGFDQGEVRAYLEVVAAEFLGLQDRIAELEAEVAASTPPAQGAPLDAATLTSLVGEETARVLRAAQEAADDLRSRAEEGAARTLTEAHEEAARIRSAAESVLAERTAEAEKTAAQVRGEAQDAAEKVTREARAEADRTIQAAVEQGRDMLGQAQAARERVLADLSRRRRAALAQVEQLRTGRERLVASLANVRAELDRIHQDLAAADEVARQAAEAAAGAADRPADGPSERAPAEGDDPTVEPKLAPLPARPGEAPAPEKAPQAEPALPPEKARQTEQALHPEQAPQPEQANQSEQTPTPQPEQAIQPDQAPPSNQAPPPAAVRPVEAADMADVTADALVAEEALISAPRKGPRRPKDPIPAPPVSRPAYVHDPVPAAVLPGAAVGGEPAGPDEPAGKVDELFARIRADRTVATDDARATLAAEPGSVKTAPEPPAAESTRPPKSGKRKKASANHPSASAPAPAGDSGLEAPRSDADETYLQRRDVLVEGVQANTVRSLRRALADDQNAALDKLRTLRGDTVSLDALLGDEESEHHVWRDRCTPGLVEGATAGAHLATGGPASTPDAALVAPIADRLATELVTALRGRLGGVLESIGKDRGPDAVDRINSVFREWRSRIDRSAGDAVTEAVSAGFVANVPTGTPVAWVVEDLDGPCPDCDDNALAGPTALGDQFPTGQAAPPAHPGCRCVLSRATT